MKPPKLPEDVKRFFQASGAQGGKSRAARHSKEQLSQWAKLGGRPKGSTKTTKGGK